MRKLIFQICFSVYFTLVFSNTTIYIDPNSVLDGNGTVISPFKYFLSVPYNTFNDSLTIFILNDYVFANDSDFINVQNFDQAIRLLILFIILYTLFSFLIIKIRSFSPVGINTQIKLLFQNQKFVVLKNSNVSFYNIQFKFAQTSLQNYFFSINNFSRVSLQVLIFINFFSIVIKSRIAKFLIYCQML